VTALRRRGPLAVAALLAATALAAPVVRADTAPLNQPDPTAVLGADLAGQSPTEAARTLMEHFPGLAAAPVAPTATARPSGSATVEAYLGAATARVRAADGSRAVVVSSTPLRVRDDDGQLRPTDLSLASSAAGGWSPANAPFLLQLAADAGGGFRLGADGAHALGVVPLDVASAAPALLLSGQSFAANAWTDTDVVLRPTLTGVEALYQLRSLDAPEQLRHRLNLQAGQRAEIAGGRLIVEQDGIETVSMLPPAATDAAGDPIPVTFGLDGDVVTLDVAHRAATTKYPVLVDPDWSSNYDYGDDPGVGLEGWHVEQSTDPGGPWYQLFVNADPDPTADPTRETAGLIVRPVGGKTYPVGVFGQLVWEAPGTTRIREARWRHVTALNDAERQTLRLALYGDGVTVPQVFDHSDTGTGFVDESITQTDPSASERFAIIRMFTPPCDVGESNCPRVVASNTNTIGKVGSVDLTLVDDDQPAVGASGALRDLAGRWTPGDEPAAGVTLNATDGGSGVDAYQLTDADRNGTHLVINPVSACDPTHNTAGQDSQICPFSSSFTGSVDLRGLPEGKHTFTARGTDFAGNASDAAATVWSTFIDRTAPAIAASGTLYDARDSWTRPDGSAALHLTGTDDRAGVRRLDLHVYDATGAEVYSDSDDTCTPRGADDAPCPTRRSTDYTIDLRRLPEGDLRFVATSTDEAGNVAAPLTWTIHLDRTPPAARATGPLVDLQGDWTNTGGQVSVTLAGKDAGSGLARLALFAVNADGREEIATRDVCGADDRAADGSCPHTATVTFSVDVSALPDGRSRFVAEATDLSGQTSVDGQDWNTYLDHTPPEAPGGLRVVDKSSDSVDVSWDRAPDSPDGSGDVSYEYMVMADGSPVLQWTSTTNTLAKVGGLPPGVTVQVLVRAIDAAKNRSVPRSVSTDTPTAVAATVNAGTARERLVKRFQPHVVVDGDEGFSPISFNWVIKSGATLCFVSVCSNRARFPLAPGDGGNERLDYPADDNEPDQFHSIEATMAAEATNQHGSPQIYSFVADPDADGTYVVQYWFFYMFNYYDKDPDSRCEHCGGLGHDLHEGDWEHVDIRFTAHDQPLRVRLSSHSYSSAYDWDDSRLHHDGTHVGVYIARGDHANYPGCGAYRIRLPGAVDAILGKSYDHTCNSPSFVLDETVTAADLGSRTLVDRFACWQGKMGGQVPGGGPAAQGWGTSPGAPLRQSEARGADASCQGTRARSSLRASFTADARAAALLTTAQPDPTRRCEGWEQPDGRLDSAVLVACDQHQLDRYYAADLDARTAPLTVRDASGRPIGTAGPPAVAALTGAGALDGLTVAAREASRLRVFAARQSATGRLEQAVFTDVALARAGRLHLHAPGTGRWTLTDDAGAIVAASAPRTSSATPTVAQAPRPRAVVARRVGGRLVVSWRLGSAVRAVRYAIESTSSTGRSVRELAVRRGTRRSRYRVVMNAGRTARYVRVVAYRGSDRTAAEPVSVRAR
jgi:hypothetical protein